jgi:hypothetical protein
MQAVGLLRELGYGNVRHYPGGLQEWFAAESADAPPAAVASNPQRTPQRSRIIPGSAAAAIDSLANRSVGALFWLWAEIVLVCAVAYWLLTMTGAGTLAAGGVPISPGIRGLAAAVYFSAVTATSVGYGDIVPMAAARVLAIGESIAGLILFGCVVSKFVSHRQEELIGEIHHIAFEDRLGRVRTNLHLVRTEIQATARLCEGREVAPPDAMARVESAAMIFVGELHAVHDLLYRGQRVDEAMLEAILAGLASVLREFTDLLACVAAQRAERTEPLRVSLRTMARLAREICGDCVPREFAPALRTWMDQIQRMAAQLG